MNNCDIEKLNQELTISDEEVVVNVEFIPTSHLFDICNGNQVITNEIDLYAKEEQNVLYEINTRIDNLSSKADTLDYAVAVASGILAGFIDSIYVDEFSLKSAFKCGAKVTGPFVIHVAKLLGNGSDDLHGAVKFLEDKYPIPADTVTKSFGGGTSHHLRDFTHHPSAIGLIFSIFTQFSRKVYGTDASGKFISVVLPDNDLIADDLPGKILMGTKNWFFHMLSDINGSSGTIATGKYGTGLPGPIVSILKEFSSLQIMCDEKGREALSNWVNELFAGENSSKFSKWVGHLFTGTLLAKKDPSGNIIKDSVTPVDFRTELGVASILAKQAMPVIINEVIVRFFFFIRTLIKKINENHVYDLHDLSKINLQNFFSENRTLERMLAVSSSVFTVIDLGDAAVRMAIESGGVPSPSVAGRVNFVGIKYTFTHVHNDYELNEKRKELIKEKVEILNEYVEKYKFKIESDMQNFEYFVDTFQNIGKALASTADEIKVKFGNNDTRSTASLIKKYGQLLGSPIADKSESELIKELDKGNIEF